MSDHELSRKIAPSALIGLICLVVLTGCGPRPTASRNASSRVPTLVDARKSHTTRLIRQLRTDEPAERPPQPVLSLARFPAEGGDFSAYVSVPTGGVEKHPAIIWIFGGFDNGIGSTAWELAPSDNDQSAAVFRQKGIITMYPSLRGGNGNPGFREGFYGEVDDVIDAAKWLAKQPYIDPKRIYLGGHSTGGTLALLVAESTGGFRAVFSFGPVDDVRGYGQDELPFSVDDQTEAELRAPVLWLNGISRPTYVFEGGSQSGNIDAVREIASASRNTNLHCYEVPGLDHFSILAQITPIIAQQIVLDTGPDVKMAFPGKKL